MLRLHWSYQYSPERYTSLLLLVNNFWTHKWSGLVVLSCVFIHTKTCLKLNYLITGWKDIFTQPLHVCCDDSICNLFEQKGSILNYGIFKMLFKFIWPMPATGINYLWLSFFFFSCSNDACSISHHQTGSSVMFWICNRWWMYNQPGGCCA